DANVIWGARINEDYNGKAKVTAIMTGVEPKWTFGGIYEARKESVAQGNGRGLSDIIPIIRH
ncbi:MAG: hypothetical protein ACXQS5_07185, partial [Candidatus Methanospirareceae archaeon]